MSASLATWDIESAPPYNAISYAWGDFSENHTIFVNSTELCVRKNCFYALQQTRLHYPGCYVWIDAICINQSDLEEKSAQVAMMGDIYKRAFLVLACIGRTDAFIRTSQEMYGKAIFQKTVLEETIEESMTKEVREKAIMKAERSMMTHRWYPDGLANAEVFFPANNEDEALIDRFRRQWNALSERPYFERAWVVQELFGGGPGGTIILAGHDSISWSRLTQSGLRLNDLLTNTVTNLTTQHFDNQIFRLHRLIVDVEGHFTKYLDQMVFLQCQDPRDRIFSAVSLVDWRSYGQTKLLPDYEMTRWQLASELMWRLVDPDINHVRHIVMALDLGKDETQLLEHLRTQGLAPCPSGYHPNVLERKRSVVNGTFIIDRNATGRFHVVPQIPLPQKIEFACNHWPPSYNDDLSKQWREYNVTPIFLRDTLIAFAYGPVRQGDILLYSDSFDLILRACSDSSSFRIIGGAYMPLSFALWVSRARKANVCECWQADPNRYVSHEVRISVKVTQREAFANAVAREAVMSGDCNLITYIECYAVGATRRGSRVWDTTTVNWHKDSTLGPSQPRCPAHKASEMHRILRNPLWYTTLSSGGPYIKVNVAS